MITWSVLAGLVGTVASWLATAQIARRRTRLRPEIPWLLGIVALLPAWLVAFVALLGRATGPRPEKALSVAWILSSSAALLGVILTDTALKGLRRSGRADRPVTCWLLGVAALAPGWGIALLGLMVRAAGR